MPKPKETPSIKSDDSLQFILEGDTKKLVLLTIYVGTVILGFIYWAIASPNESLWSQKSNPFNKYFVKNGWFWTSILFFWCRGLEVNAFFRWLSATAYWYIITQEFFGPSIIDRFFVITGGRCSDVSLSEAYTCKKGNGHWYGGHDVSGHCLFLIHASLFLWEEVVPLYHQKNKNVSNRFMVALLILWWWMLFMTAIYFHSFLENLTGTTLGVSYWLLFYHYILPRSRNSTPHNNQHFKSKISNSNQ